MRTIQCSSVWRFNGTQELRTCSAEDLIIHKCYASRDHDWSDVESVLVRPGERLDLRLVRQELRPFAEAKAGEVILARLQRMIRRSRPGTGLLHPAKRTRRNR